MFTKLCLSPACKKIHKCYGSITANGKQPQHSFTTVNQSLYYNEKKARHMVGVELFDLDDFAVHLGTH
jgi:hypothetical protein